jgi:hypothetical protein
VGVAGGYAEKALEELSVHQRNVSDQLRQVVSAVEKLAPSRKRESMTWFYENLRVRADDDR